MWLFKPMYDSYSIGSLRSIVNHLGIVVSKLVGFHHRHLRPVREIDTVLKQTDAKRVRNDSASVHHRLSKRTKQNIGLRKCIYFMYRILKDGSTKKRAA